MDGLKNRAVVLSFCVNSNDTSLGAAAAAAAKKKKTPKPLKVSSKKKRNLRKETFECSSASGTLCSFRT